MSRREKIRAGDPLPAREYQTDNVQLFLYNAVLWNAHRIHYDFPYATEVEGYSGLVNAGPLMGDWLTQCINEWLGEDGCLKSLQYSNRKASIIGERLRCDGKVLSMNTLSGDAELEVRVLNEKQDVVIPATATVHIY